MAKSKVKKPRKRAAPVEYPSDPLVLARAIFKAADKKRDKRLGEAAQKNANDNCPKMGQLNH